MAGTMTMPQLQTCAYDSRMLPGSGVGVRGVHARSQSCLAHPCAPDVLRARRGSCIDGACVPGLTTVHNATSAVWLYSCTLGCRGGVLLYCFGGSRKWGELGAETHAMPHVWLPQTLSLERAAHEV